MTNTLNIFLFYLVNQLSNARERRGVKFDEQKEYITTLSSTTKIVESIGNISVQT